MRRKLIGLLMTAVVVCSLTACGKSDSEESTSGVAAVVESNSSATSDSDDTNTLSYTKFDATVEFDDEDMDTSESGGEQITLNDNTAETESSNVKISGNTVTITAGGTYIISGTFSDGQIVVNSEDDNVVHIVLKSATITCTNSSPIYIAKAKKTVLTIAEGTNNTLTDSENYELAEGEDEPSAVIFSKDDLSINGTGTLTVNANYNNGIASKDDLKIIDTTIKVTAKNNGIKGKDSLGIKDANITVTSQGDGIKSDNTTDTDKGYIFLDNIKLTVTATQDGIQAESCMMINGGTLDITTGGGSVNASTKSEGNWGNWGNNSSNTTTTETSSAKAIKAGCDITIEGGTFTIDSSDDSIHSNDSADINPDKMDIVSGDDGIHADTVLNINGGTINITKSYEGIESTTINMNGGNINITSSDDGINAAGGVDSSSVSGRPGQNGMESTTSGTLYINGGTIFVNASGDGVDANGSIYMKGGDVVVYGPTDNGNGATDYDNEFVVTGGSFLAIGSSGMAQATSQSSTINGVLINTTSSNSAGTSFAIKDADGNEILSVEPTKQYNSVLYVNSNLKTGETYTIYAGTIKVDTFTVSSSVTTVGSTSGFGGGGGFGGGRK